MAILGIDIGGSGIKGGLVDLRTGALVAPRHRLPTPENSLPDDVATVVEGIRQDFQYRGLIGVGFPAIVHRGVAYSAANINPTWIGKDIASLIHAATGSQTYVLNDADAAGIAEMNFGAGKGTQQGVVLMLTIGTGIGSAIFVDGHLLPNTEFGHLQIRGKDAEKRASDATRKRKDLDWKAWTKRLQEFLSNMELLICPDLIIIGGGVSKYYDQFFPFLKLRAPIVPAKLENEAGIIGAAIYANQHS